MADRRTLHHHEIFDFHGAMAESAMLVTRFFVIYLQIRDAIASNQELMLLLFERATC